MVHIIAASLSKQSTELRAKAGVFRGFAAKNDVASNYCTTPKADLLNVKFNLWLMTEKAFLWQNAFSVVLGHKVK